MENYKIDFVSKTLIITSAFEKAMQDKSPTKYHTASGDVLNCNPYKHLTYESMERFMSGLRQRDELMEVYYFIKNHAVLPQTSRYTAVRRWLSTPTRKCHFSPE